MAADHHDAPEEVVGEGDVTAPVDLLEKEKDPHVRSELEVVKERYENDPSYRALWNMMRRQRRESNEHVVNRALQVQSASSKLEEYDTRLDELHGWRKEVETILKLAKWILGVVLTVALGSVIVLATKIYNWGLTSGELETKVQELESAMHDLQHQTTLPSQSYPQYQTPPYPSPPQLPQGSIFGSAQGSGR